MPYYVVLLRSNAPTQSFTVRADRWVEEAGACRFFRDDALVYQLSCADVIRVEAHDTDKQARDALLDFRRASSGGATVHVEEAAPAAPRRRDGAGAPVAIPAEGISFRIEEP